MAESAASSRRSVHRRLPNNVAVSRPRVRSSRLPSPADDREESVPPAGGRRPRGGRSARAALVGAGAADRLWRADHARHRPRRPGTPVGPADAPAAARAGRAAPPPRRTWRRDGFLHARPARTSGPRPDRWDARSDGSWRVDIPGGALGGTRRHRDRRDTAVTSTSARCRGPPAAEPCRASAVGRELTPEVDPRVQHLFTTGREVLTDRARRSRCPTPHRRTGSARGACFSRASPRAASLARAAGRRRSTATTADGTLTGARARASARCAAGPAPARPRRRRWTMPGAGGGRRAAAHWPRRTPPSRAPSGEPDGQLTTVSADVPTCGRGYRTTSQIA